MSSDKDDSSDSNSLSRHFSRASTISDGEILKNRISKSQEDSGDETCKSSSANNTNGNKHLRMLRFANPGRFMEDFDPECSAREMRKMNRRIYRESARKNQMYDENGKLLMDSRDLCDCLEEKCPGCHYPCPRCGSEKCGLECRCNRRWIYQDVEVEGTDTKFVFPGLNYQPS